MLPAPRSGGRPLALAAAASILACGGGAALPADVSVGDVTVETNPLTLVIHTPSSTLRIPGFVALGEVTRVDSSRYYDPAAPPAVVTWRSPERAVGYDAATGTLDLEGGGALRLALGDHGEAMLTVVATDDAVLTRLSFPRDPGEAIFGFGESFASAFADGDVREMQLRVDPSSESATNETHAPVPLALWPRRGLGVFVEDRRPGAFDIGKTDESLVTATFTTVGGAPLATHLFTAEEPLDLLRTYARLTSLPAVPPLWAFAPQQWRNVHNSSDEIIDDATAMRALGIPTGVMWIDNPWQTAYNDFEFDEGRFAEIDGVLAQVEALGYRVLVWSTPYVNTAMTKDYAAAASLGYLVTDDVGEPFVFPWQDGPGALVDFTAEGATAWWRERIRRATSIGIDGFKLDFGEDLLPELGGNLTPFTLAKGNAQSLHRDYATYYHEAYLGALPAADGFIITRAGSYGGQAVNTCIWPGDLDSDMSRHGALNPDGSTNVGGLPAAIAGGLSLSVSGYPFYGSDIGGFREGSPTTETLLRWAQYASLGTIMQLGGGGNSHNPWDADQFDTDLAIPIYRTYARLHMQLVPYLYSLAVVAGRDGTPVTRPTRFVYPESTSDDATFLVGDDLFVAPVVEEGTTERTVVLPPGEWVHWWTGEAVVGDGRTTIHSPAAIDTLPLWRRKGALIPMFARDADTLGPASATDVTSYADEEIGRELRVLSTPASGSFETVLWDGARIAIASSGAKSTLSATAGSQFSVVTFDLDGSVDDWVAPASVQAAGLALTATGDQDQLNACPAPGCYWWDAATQRLQVRLWTGAASAAEVVR